MTEASPEKTYRLKVQRSGREPGAADRFEVAISNPHARVLDALIAIRQEQDPTLGFRFSCRVGMCGSCAVVVNGRERLACQTTLASLGTSDITVAPLRSLPVKHDLTPDMEPFFDSMRRAGAALDPKEPELREIRTMPPDDKRRATIEQLNGCITCGACFSACEWTRSHPGYLGPSALVRLYMLAMDERDAAGPDRASAAATAEGALRCHAMGSCSAVCPAEIPLKEGMQRLKGLVARSG